MARRGAGEHHEEPVALRLHLGAPVPIHLRPHQVVVVAQHGDPPAVAQALGQAGGADDVGDHHRQRAARTVRGGGVGGWRAGGPPRPRRVGRGGHPGWERMVAVPVAAGPHRGWPREQPGDGGGDVVEDALGQLEEARRPQVDRVSPVRGGLGRRLPLGAGLARDHRHPAPQPSGVHSDRGRVRIRLDVARGVGRPAHEHHAVELDTGTLGDRHGHAAHDRPGVHIDRAVHLRVAEVEVHAAPEREGHQVGLRAPAAARPTARHDADEPPPAGPRPGGGGRRGRGAVDRRVRRRAGLGHEPGREAAAHGLQLGVGLGRVHRAGQVGELVERQPAGPGVGPQHVDGLLALGVADAVVGPDGRARRGLGLGRGLAFVPPVDHGRQSRAPHGR